MAQRHKVVTVTRRLWVRSPLEEKKYLFKCIFPFLRSGVAAKRGVEFRHSTRHASEITLGYTRFLLSALGSHCLQLRWA